MNIFIKRFLAFFLSFTIIFSTTFAYANTSIGGWTALDTITAGATNTINAVKGAGATGMRSAVAVAPSAVKVGKHLIKGGGAAALLLAVPQILGEGVDWVLDPANNRVKYTVPASVGSGSYWTLSSDGDKIGISSTSESACRAYVSWLDARTPSISEVYVGVEGNQCKFTQDGSAYSSTIYQAVGDSTPSQEKYIPIDTVAAQVISNAEAGHAPSQEAVKATALEGFAAGEHDAALDAAAVPDTGVENPPDTENPPKDPDAPAEPFDPAGIISAINALKALLAGILSSITSLSDFFQSEPPPEPTPEDTQLDIPVPDVVPADTDINFGGSCPANFEVNSSIFGNPINIVLLDTAKFCGFLSTFVKYPVYAVSSLFALYILGGRKDV